MNLALQFNLFVNEINKRSKINTEWNQFGNDVLRSINTDLEQSSQKNLNTPIGNDLRKDYENFSNYFNSMSLNNFNPTDYIISLYNSFSLKGQEIIYKYLRILNTEKINIDISNNNIIILYFFKLSINSFKEWKNSYNQRTMTAQLSNLINKHDEIVKEPHLNIKQFLYNSNSDYMNYYYNILNIVYSNKDLVINLINFYEENYKNLLIDNDASQKLKIEELQKNLNELKNENNNLKDKYNNLEKETCDIALNLDKDNDSKFYISELSRRIN